MALSNSARLLAGYMQATGISDAKIISDALGVPLRTIQRLKLDIAMSANDATGGVFEDAKSAKCATGGVLGSATSAMDGVLENANSATGGVESAKCAMGGANGASPIVGSNILYLSKTSNTVGVAAAEPPPTRKQARGSRLPEEWVLPEAWRDWALTNCPASSHAAVEREALKFANYWQAKSGSGATKLNWFKTWQNWCLTAFSTAPVRGGVQAAQPKSQAREFLAELERGEVAL